MFPGPRGFTLTSVIGRLNRTLSVANQVIPLYMKAKPIMKNAKDAFAIAKTFMTPTAKPVNNTNVNPQIKKTVDIRTVSSANKPVFFL